MIDHRQGEPAQKLLFFAGLFVVAASILAVQILQTRILSVMSHYFLAFFTISMAMLGMTAGALILYFLDRHFPRERFYERLSSLAMIYALALVLSWVMLITTSAEFDPRLPIMTSVVLLKLIIALIPPYIVGGLIISLALTRSPFPIGTTYAVDLIGAASGCFLVLALMEVLDGVSALLSMAALGAIGALAFRVAEVLGQARNSGRVSAAHFLWPVLLIATILAAVDLNSALYPYGAKIVTVKGRVENAANLDRVDWNSFSRIGVSRPYESKPFVWGPAPNIPAMWREPFNQRHMLIDGQAGTALYGFTGDRDALGFLEYDITNLAYHVRNNGESAVIGVGGGRDVLSAWYFGFDEITGIDINPIFIENLRERYADYNAAASLPEVTFEVDEARSWFARTDQRFDLIQMSLVDTWAATGVGAYSLTENGLYTVEAWRIFLGRLTDNGVFTVSRWYSPGNPAETARLIALAKATLLRMGVENPDRNLYLAGTERLATLIMSPEPFSDEDLARLDVTVREKGYVPLYGPNIEPDDPVIRRVQEAGSFDELAELPAGAILDYSPPTDSQPFFFNQLRFSSVLGLLTGDSGISIGVLSGNLIATVVLLLIIVISLIVVVATILVPTLPVLATVPVGTALLGSGYFFLIGAGFMFVEIGLMQRLSIMLGHPVYGLAIALAGIILSTGLGSALSERVVLSSTTRLTLWAIVTAGYVGALPFLFPALVEALAGTELYLRGAASLLIILPAGLAMGFGFPTGMRLVSAIDERPTPWFWAINGAAGVFASGLSIAISTFVSVDATLWTGSAAYLLLVPFAVGLVMIGSAGRAAQHGVSAGAK